MVEAIHKFWRLCSNRLRGDESRYGRLLSNLVLLAAFLDRLTDQTKDLLLQAAPYGSQNQVLRDLKACATDTGAVAGARPLELAEAVDWVTVRLLRRGEQVRDGNPVRALR